MKYIQYINEFHNGNSNEIFFIQNFLEGDNQTEVEEILDYLFNHQDLDISKMSYKLLNERKNKWHKKLQSVSSKDTEVEGTDYQVILDFKDGFRIVKLISKEAYEREGKLMSHCVASYFGRDVEIYSLRDSKNLPHCTIEKDQQVKGKGNGSIDPKYIDYVVKFLESIDMEVGENEMKNLGYYKIDSIDKGLTSELAYNGYIHEGKLNTLKDSEGRVYKGMGLWNVKPLVDIDNEGNCRLFEDIKSIEKYSALVLGENNQPRDYSRQSQSGHSSRQSQSEHSSQQSQSGDCSQQSQSGDSSRQSQSGRSSQQSQSGRYSRQSQSGHSSRQSQSGRYSQQSQSGEYSRQSQSGDSSRQCSCGTNSRGEVKGKYGITADIGKDSMSKGIIGTWIVLAEYDNNEEGYLYPKNVKCAQIDGIILKEDTWYTLKDGEFSEVNE